MLFFLDVLQKARDEFELRKHMRNLHEEHQEKPTFEDELKTYSDEGLTNLEEKLTIEMDGLTNISPLYDELSYQYIALLNEMEKRNLMILPF
jgi:hypothetical protein